jgi:hypothetical protein
MRYRFFSLAVLTFFVVTIAVSAVAQGGGGNRNDRDQGSNNAWWNRDPKAPWPPNGNWHGGHWGPGGACFYKDRNFGGSYFCMRRGEQRDSLPGYGNDISSIRTFGGARVIVFDKTGFRGARERLGDNVRDLRRVGVTGMGNHTWNNRISSIRVQ